MASNRRTYDMIKRPADVLLGLLLLIVTLPIQAVVGVLVRRKLGSPVLFRQQRPGLGGKVFTLYKFRTMRDIDEAAGVVSDEDRLTPFGTALRSTSLDELPTLWNVVKGDMSMIGPRPLLVEYLKVYSPEQARRHEVRPGMTGLAQVSGRNAMSWEEKFRLDVEYVDKRSFWLDTKIFFATIRTVLVREGISAPGEATATKFTGSRDA
ncbi:sugar transferase [Lysinibacter cavernae]|uniref:Lipopolysaccharide/colanic/teichoic acid biosynthesis glycosyltransferase n=1 Tax=Lysinibacter cavernae TaxID=1640652 RepID=A0A7X5R1S5_9MICO|nr:sugar transferase [Lysinibacter cavernae]NIH54120.1 lipopolysaccharide/colanic/teichoic acid biosynthesis glycosyltransferase [Lysinibacter cavernae]